MPIAKDKCYLCKVSDKTFDMKQITRLGLLFLLAFLGTTQVAAQKKTEKAENTEKNVVEKTEAEQMMDEYRFEDAIELLEKDIATAKKRKKPYERLDSLLQQARRGSILLNGTERVVFIDSIVADKSKVLSLLHLDKECGSIISGKDLKAFDNLVAETPGHTAYLNELNDKIIFSHTPKGETQKKLATSLSTADEWSPAMPLPGISQRHESQDYPFMLADGVTMYYAAEGEESFGGYDIFVTRYNPDTKTFFKPENIGMPFNSPANDYLYLIDERYDIGWFVSDRHQPEGKVCIYTFIPNTTRKTYDMAAYEEAAVQRAARIHSIAESQTDKAEVAKARQRIEEIKRSKYALNIMHTERYIINDDVVYTSLSEFRSERAREFAAQCEKMRRTLEQKQLQLEEMRKKYAATSPRSATFTAEVQKLEHEVMQQQESIRFMEKNMRKEELHTLQNKR